MREPSLKRTLRTAPTESPAPPPSMTLADSDGCQRACPLKSRSVAQSSSAAAGITVDAPDFDHRVSGRSEP